MKILTITDEQYTQLMRTLTDRFEAVVAERFSNMLKQVEVLQFTLDRFGHESSTDRKDIADMKIDMATINQQLKEVVDLISHQERVISDRVKESLSKTAQTVSDNIQPTVENTLHKFVETNSTKIHAKRRYFWQFWR